MQSSDSFTEFLTQSGVLNLVIAVVVMGIIWLALFTWVLRRENERRRRRKAGEPPLPNALTQLFNMIQGNNPNATNNQSALQSQAMEMPLPSMDDLTTDLPEPDFDDLTAPQETQPPSSPEHPAPQPQFADVPDPDEQVVEAPPPATTMPEHIGAEPERSAEFSFQPGSNQLPADAVEIMRVWRDVSDGSLIFQMGDRVFQTLPEMHDNGFSQRFIKIVEDMARVAHAGALASGLNPPDFQKSSAIISQQGDWARRQVPPLTSPTVEPTIDPQFTQIATSVAGSGGGSIADQIEEMLQRRLSQTPAFQHRSIHVRSNPDGTIRIVVDGRTYPHVDEVIDPDVRDFIQNVIREWEARQ
jgi:hypothetical protein